ncbi:hypothetical protein SAMN00790413_05439 [Deinococcus hopiensis KR-140]|uniref:Uncharacterized protein n=1 Tax=Deinococcus hopiensis KR-140 TaxID=695939 RepID=A0A1W1UGD1_9DEIO|nr:hypothetical protein SAMN00790413_05439 [Deinococcus hopiensis KR-140]
MARLKAGGIEARAVAGNRPAIEAAIQAPDEALRGEEAQG